MELIFGRNYYTVEFVDRFIAVNVWVDLRKVKLACNNADSWMVRDYMDRLSHIIAYKEERGLLVDLFVRGPDAKAALRAILHDFTQVGSLSVFVRTKPLGSIITVTTADYHPSNGIMSGKRDVQVATRDQFCLCKAVCAVSDVARSSCRPITEAAITAELNEEHHRRIQMVSKNIRVFVDFLQGNFERKQEVVDRFPSIGYNGVSWAVSTVTYLEEKSGGQVTVAERTMLVTRWIWEEKHYVHEIAYLKVQSVEEYLKGVTTATSFIGFKIALQTAGALERKGFSPSLLAGNGGAWKAQKTMLQTAGALEREGFSPSLLAGNGGAWKAQKTMLQTARALERKGFSPSLLVGASGAWKA
jgi:hypothetical protein